MANQSQCLDDAPFRGFRGWSPPSLPVGYSEAQRLALEELVAAGRPAFHAFLRREKMRSFLSEPEIRTVLRAAVPPPGPDDSAVAADQALNTSMDCSSLTYFPEQSDVEPPVLELGWPAFVSGSFRGLTRVETYFQPSFGEIIYPCKEMVRKQIQSAREVIAIVMDSFTDMDILSDLQEACRKRRIPVYILLDQAFLCNFMEMCKNLDFCPEKENLMRVRTITGITYYARSGAKIIGSVHEKFMLVDGVRVTTGSYSFTWTDGKLNSSNLLLLSGQVVEHFDLEFRILYADSKPVNTRLSSSCRNSAAQEQPASQTPCKDFTQSNLLRAEFARLSSTPKKLEREIERARELQEGRVSVKRPHLSGEEQWHDGPEFLAKAQESKSQSTQTETLEEEKPSVTLFNCATQTSISVATATTQTTTRSRMAGTQTAVVLKSAATQTGNREVPDVVQHQKIPDQRIPNQRMPSKEGSPISRKSTSTSSSARSLSSLSSQCSRASSAGSLTSLRSMDYSPNHRGEYFRKLSQERDIHYSVIQSKLNHMVSLLSRRGNVAENYIGCRPIRCNLKPRRQISTSLINLRDFALYRSNDCF
ncbi:protein FAM83D [Varanus komodoensis]|uniref:Family with sequence similarity 83 member D n=1 Tax=Varanus komodoensis TaxID=61221 RepID=A0A8D2L8Q5_VARKO|nr:protein FAM83D [Varanus komodoensis]